MEVYQQKRVENQSFFIYTPDEYRPSSRKISRVEGVHLIDTRDQNKKISVFFF